MKQRPLYLSKHTFFCLADHHYVFLDLRSNAYICLARAHTDAVKALLNGYSVVDERSAYMRLYDSSDADAVIQALVQKGMLVESEASGKLPTQARVDAPAASLIEDLGRPCLAFGPSHVWNFLIASSAASKHLRWQSIEQTVRTVEARKSAQATAAMPADNARITNLFGIFRMLRPYYPRRYLCLFDSLALLHFLARYGVFPQWVYGVKLEPFGAHCWVQAGGLVVNDIIDNVRTFTPIMSV